MINIAIDNVPLDRLEEISELLEALFKDYPDKRINISIQDTPLVKFG